MEDKRIRRLLYFVEQMKQGRYPNAERFGEWLRGHEWEQNMPLAVSVKTVQRDIKYLREQFSAPLVYDTAAKGYSLSDSNWSLPYLSLAEDELFAALFSGRVSESFLPTPIQQTMTGVKSIQLAAGDPGTIAPDVIESVIVATGATVPMAHEVARTVLEAWKDTRRLRIAYVRGSDEGASEREIDIHALFLADGAWYARAWCHLRQGMRTFALHRIRQARLLDTRYERSATVVAEVRRGGLFSYDMVRDVRVVCARERAMYFRERVWFAGQQIQERPDGSLEACYPFVPGPLLEPWVMSFLGAVTVVAPEELRLRIRASAARLLANHGGGSGLTPHKTTYVSGR